MSTISKEHSDRLYWLGRYTERAFTTLRTIQKLYDKIIDKQKGYTDYQLTKQLLPLPVDQRYGTEEMKRIIELI